MSYRDLAAHHARIGRLTQVAEMLHWDSATMMPRGGAEARAEQLATLEVLQHQLATDARIGEWVEAAEGESLSQWESANLREIRRNYLHATAVPEDLVEALSKATSRCEMAWRTARPANDFDTMVPLLEEVLGLARRSAQAKAEAMGLGLYDALLDQYEPGGRCERIDGLFEDLAGFLPELTQKVIEHQAAKGPAAAPTGPFPQEKQRALGLRMMGVLGFDFDHGRLDVSHHPFCGGTPDDVRITTRYREDDWTQSLMGVLHETGHALYEMGLPAEWRAQPVGNARGMSVHESQSLLMEMQACRSKEFIGFMAPHAAEIFGGGGEGWAPENLYRLYTKVERGLIRVDADELTYPAHVILRYRLERAMIGGQLEIKDLPGAWNEGMQSLVGAVPPDFATGCLQDIHWVEGLFGYFPTYTLGAMTAAQLFDAACRADAQVLPSIGRGDFAPLLAWLRENVHSQGSLHDTDELLTRATGKPLDAKVFEAHLERRYLA